MADVYEQKNFTEEQLQMLHENPYVYSVSEPHLFLAKKFKKRFMTVYNVGMSSREILETHELNIDVIGDRRLSNIRKSNAFIAMFKRSILLAPSLRRRKRNHLLRWIKLSGIAMRCVICGKK